MVMLRSQNKLSSNSSKSLLAFHPAYIMYTDRYVLLTQLGVITGLFVIKNIYDIMCMYMYIHRVRSVRSHENRHDK